MKSLTLLRHAKSERDSPDGTDFARPLNDRGRADSKRIGEEMRRLGLVFDLVLASPAKRAVETAERVEGLSPQFDRRIYDASTGQLFDIIRGVDDRINRLLLIGHNPGFERVAAGLSGGEVDTLPTGALIEIDLPVDRWREIGDGNGRLVRLIRPKYLA